VWEHHGKLKRKKDHTKEPNKYSGFEEHYE
jgi:hypothetical protein